MSKNTNLLRHKEQLFKGNPSKCGGKMNHTTPSRRAEWIDYARRLIVLNDRLVTQNMDEVVSAVQAKFGVSLQSARTATMHAVFRERAARIKQRG